MITDDDGDKDSPINFTFRARGRREEKEAVLTPLTDLEDDGRNLVDASHVSISDGGAECFNGRRTSGSFVSVMQKPKES